MTKIKPLSFLFAAEVLLLMAIAYAQPVHALTAPKNLTANVASTTQINLKWDRVWGASSYRVFRASKQIATVRGTTFSNINLTPNTSYSYNVAAVDTRWRQSPLSNTATATTLTDTNPPPTTTAEVGYIGCSMTMAAANGALNLGMTNLWSTKPEYGGGGISQWKDFNSKYWTAFQNAYNAQPVNVIWYELCAVEQTKADETYDNALLILDELKRRIPGVTVYVSAQPAYNPSSHECGIAGVGGQSRMASIAAQLVSAGEAITGPTQGPLEYPSQVKTDGCHPIASGEQVLGKQLMDFFLTKTPPPPSASAGIASGLFLVDDRSADYNKALTDPNIDGTIIRSQWSQLEPTEGAYNFKPLCDQITAVHKLNKQVAVINYPLPPSWLLAKVPTSEQWTLKLGARSVQTITPWNATGLAAMEKLANAQANFVCEGVKLKEHPSVTQVDQTVFGALSIRDKPDNSTLSQMTDGVLKSVDIWKTAFTVPNDKKAYFLGTFPLGRGTTAVADSKAIVSEVLKRYPLTHTFLENHDVTGIGNSEPFKLAKYHIVQACGEFGSSKIKCSGTGKPENTPRNAFDTILKPIGGIRSYQIYPADVAKYPNDMVYLHQVLNTK